jgi:hypothetical protein
MALNRVVRIDTTEDKTPMISSVTATNFSTCCALDLLVLRFGATRNKKPDNYGVKGGLSSRVVERMLPKQN